MDVVHNRMARPMCPAVSGSNSSSDIQKLSSDAQRRQQRGMDACESPSSRSSGRHRTRSRRSRLLDRAPHAIAQALWLMSLPTVTLASPTPLVKRDSGGVAKIIAPVVAVCAVVLIGFLILLIRRGWHRRVADWSGNVASNFGPQPGVQDGERELTAAQLAGPGAPVTARSRRRRNRRTPSQISTRSLPIYMKEPGENEIVIYRGPDDLEDLPTTANVVMPPVAETAEMAETAETPDLTADTPNGSEDAASRIYVPMPDSPNDMPLLAGHASRLGTTRSSLAPPAGITPPGRSADTFGTEDSNTALLQSRSPEPDPRGEAPPYFEVVAMDGVTVSTGASPALSFDSPQLSFGTGLRLPFGASPQLSLDDPPTPDPAAAAESSAHAPAETSRRSRFLNLFHHRHSSSGRNAGPGASNDGGAPAPASGHARQDSNTPSDSSHDAPRVRSRSTHHRPSFSGSGSMFSAMSRSRSRLLDQANLTSPSMISLNSISAPLPHTLVRTEFTYPRTGPTPEQIALISSRESFFRFGVPYGEEAIAFASSSRMDLSVPDVPPPEFEAVEGGQQARLAVAETLVEEPTPREVPRTLPSDGASTTTDSPDSDSDSPASSIIEGESQAGSTDHAAPSPGSPSTAPAEHVSAFAASPPAATAPSASAPASTEIARPAGQQTPAATSSSWVSPPADTSHPPGLNVLSPFPVVPKNRSPLSQTTLPFPARAESRASTSNASFATAAESLKDEDGDEDEGEDGASETGTMTASPMSETFPTIAVSVHSDGYATPAAEGARTPRVAPREVGADGKTNTSNDDLEDVDENNDDDDDERRMTITPATLARSSSGVGQAL